MSASSDKSQKPAFIFTSPRLIRIGEAKPSQAFVQVKPYDPAKNLKEKLKFQRSEISSLRTIPAKETRLKSAKQDQNEALGALKTNLKVLNELHSRLKFMLKELETLTKKKRDSE